MSRYPLAVLLLAVLAAPGESAPCRRGRFLFPQDMVVEGGPATLETVSVDPSHRVLFTITLQAYESDVQVWAQKIRAAIATIRLEHPTVRQIVLQPVVGGPMGAVCPVQSQPLGVRASYNAPYIERAITIVVGDSPDLVAGFVPEVQSCGDYLDDIGHLAPSARGPIGLTIGQYYGP